MKPKEIVVIIPTKDIFVGDPKAAIMFPKEDMLDTQLTEHALQPGDTLAGWIGLVCPARNSLECRPAFLRYTITDSLGDVSQYISSSAQKDAAPLHDWIAEAYMHVGKVDRDFTGNEFVSGNCGGGGVLSRIEVPPSPAPQQ